MKNFLFLLSFAVSLSVASAQTPTFGKAQAADRSGYIVTDRGPHHRIWSRVVTVTEPDGTTAQRTISYTELATGMHFWDGTQWQETSTAIESYPNGAIARNGPHKVIFASNLNTPGAIDLQTPDGKRLQSQPIALSYFDSSSGQSVLLAELKDCQGQIDGNQVLYPDAFTDIAADVRFTYTQAGFEQDILLRQQLPSPTEWGMIPASTRLQVLTEFIDAPEPRLSTVDRNGLADERIDFGAMVMGSGRAFDLGETQKLKSGVPVAKSWVTLENRHILVEEVEYPAIQPHLETLPPPAQSVAHATRPTLHRVLPAPRLARNDSHPMKLAKVAARSGFVLDYTMASSAAGITFQGDTTYYVSDEVDLSGTTTIEGGCVIKFAPGDAGFIAVGGPCVCKTGPYRPAIFTARDDDTVGESITGSTGSPSGYYAGAALYFPGATNSIVLSYIRLLYADFGIYFDSFSNHVIANSQFLNCDLPINSEVKIFVRNALLSHIEWGFSGGTIDAENVTAATVDHFENLSTLTVTNSLLVNISHFDSFTGAYNATNGSGIFQTNGTGWYYLATNSPYRNAGTTNINAALLADLKKATTYPPMMFTNPITTDTILNPQAQRDTDTPDLGYHYAPIDYLTACTVSNAALILTNGVTVAYYNATGIQLQNNGLLSSTGAPQQRNYLVHCRTAQEEATNLAPLSSSVPIKLNRTDTNANPSLALRFTSIAALQGESGLLFEGQGTNFARSITFQDCEIFGQGAHIDFVDGLSTTTVQFLNNLLWYVQFDAEHSGAFTFRNNFFLRQWCYFVCGNATPWPVKDNVFDQSDVGLDTDSDYDYNGYATNTAVSGGPHTHDIVTNFVWQTGPLGDFYQPTNSGFLNKGSRTADLAALYHYTTTTNQVKETNSIVDIGYHYVAVDANGIPIDTDGDGWPDYYEDANGNGTVDSGETDWQSATDLGLKVWITRPRNNSTLP